MLRDAGDEQQARMQSTKNLIVMTDSLASDEVVIWHALTGSLTASYLAQVDNLLSDDERARRDRFVLARDRRDFAVAHGLLRVMLSTYRKGAPGHWRFEHNRFGKPSLGTVAAGAPPLVFNLSHTDGLVACAVALDTDLGIDVERIGDRVMAGRDIAARYFAPSEIHALECIDAEDYAQKFIELWTLKEAYIKALGVGLECPLDGFAIDVDAGQGIRLRTSAGSWNLAWQFDVAVPSPQHRLAVAVRCDAGRRYRVKIKARNCIE